MPKRTDIHKILIIGSGPIIISQGCEFDYSGTQACKSLKEEGYSVILVNSNPATIMTDPQMADRIYIEPITPEIVTKIIERERPDAILPTLGGQTGLNVAVNLVEMGVLEKFNVEMIGAKYEAIKKAEDRHLFKKAMQRIGLRVPKSDMAKTMEEARKVADELGFPLIIRPSFTLGGTGGGVVYNVEEFEKIAARGLSASMTSEILIEESALGWKEYELEVMRDIKDNVVIICSIENFDPMGVHTGDSITVAPAQTLSDKEYQRMRDAAIAIIREIGVETGGSNIQFAVHPEDGRMVVIEMNPRVSRSSALASKATGFPIAKIAAKLAVGLSLDEIPNDITKETPASFEPSIDYCVVKLPRFTFEKFPQAEDVLGISMRSVGEAMAIGRTFKEALQKGLRSLEIGRFGLGADGKEKVWRLEAGGWSQKEMGNGKWEMGNGKVRSQKAGSRIYPNPEPRIPNPESRTPNPEPRTPNLAFSAESGKEVKEKLIRPNSERIFYVREAIKMGMEIDQIYELTKIDKWFLENIRQIVEMEEEVESEKLGEEEESEKLKVESGKSQEDGGWNQKEMGNGKGERGKGKVRRQEDGGWSQNLSESRIPNPESRTPNPEPRTLNPEPRIPNPESRISSELLRKAKEYGFSDRQLAHLLDTDEEAIRNLRKKHGIEATFKLVDTCAAEFEAWTPYYYSTYETEDEAHPTKKKKVVILGGGPNRIGQGIEFDYCCCQAAFALKEEGYESIMVNCNPETVSTDYDTSDRLYFEPMTREDILNIVEKEKPEGVIIQLGGQTPLNLAIPLEKAGVKILGTSTDSIDRAEDRKRFKELLQRLGLKQTPNDTGTSPQEAKKIAEGIGYPVLMRPSYVLGGRAMEIVYDEEELEKYMREAVEASPEHPVLVDKFLEDAIEVDVDAISDGEMVVIAGIMEHIEHAGIHSGDSACVLPPHTLSAYTLEEIRQNTYSLAKELNVIGLINIQYAIRENEVYVLEVNPRASRTIPFVSKAIGVSLANLATKVMLGKTLKELGFTQEVIPEHVAVKEVVFPFLRFPGVDTVLGPEMKSTGEVMGLDATFGMAFAKSQLAAGQILPKEGTIFISVKDKDKPIILPAVERFVKLGFNLVGTAGTWKFFSEKGFKMGQVFKVSEGRPDVVDLMKNGEIALVINTPSGKKPRQDEVKIRTNAYLHSIPIITTAQGVLAAADGIEALIKGELKVKSIQEYHQ